MFAGNAFYLGHLGRTPVYVLPEAIFTLLFVAVIASSVQSFLLLLMALLTAILLHEYGHAVAARIAGMGGITIAIGALGGTCFYSGQPDARRSIGISLAGPGANLALAAALFAGTILFPAWGSLPPLVVTFLGLLFLVNLSLGIFNLLPIYPLDGGHATLGALRFARVGETKARQYTLYTAFIAAPISLAVYTTWFSAGNPPIFTILIVGLLLWRAWSELR